jgi:uncharacterized membrane protein
VPVEIARSRRPYIDWARGLAVLLMIEWHTADAWTRVADRQSTAFGRVLVLGGFAAPLFLWLAGLGVSFSAARFARANGSRVELVRNITIRGLEIFILAFLFRIQAFIITPGSHPITIFRVDILNIMGPSIVAAALVLAIDASGRTRALWYAAAATAVGMMTPIVRTSSLIRLLPPWFQWYLRPAGDLTTFTLFPWAGFVFAGAACGVILASADDKRTERRAHLAFAGAGLLLVVAADYLSRQPSIYQQSEFWTSSPTWFAMRIGILMMAIAALYGVAEVVPNSARCHLGSLERLGQSSLFVYWIHVELVYGYATWPLHGRLPLWGTLAGYVLFCVLMYRAVIVRDRVVDKWRTRSRPGPARRPATA